MAVTSYRKLVRDRIPEIIARDGKTCVCETLDEADYRVMLDAKLREELGEYLEAHAPEELADLLEVIRASARAHGSSIEEIERIRARKAEERGAFEKRILLVETRSKRTSSD